MRREAHIRTASKIENCAVSLGLSIRQYFIGLCRRLPLSPLRNLDKPSSV